MVNVFTVLRNEEQADQLYEKLRLTPYSFYELQNAEIGIKSEDPIERARCVLLKSWLGVGGYSFGKTGFKRPARKKNIKGPASQWANWLEYFPNFITRIRNVHIESIPAAKVIEKYDGPDTLFYIDPPYVQEAVPTVSKLYEHSLTTQQHVDLLTQLRGVVGQVVLSGYHSELYNDMLPDWNRSECQTRGMGGERCEVLWVNR